MNINIKKSNSIIDWLEVENKNGKVTLENNYGEYAVYNDIEGYIYHDMQVAINKLKDMLNLNEIDISL